ncbi:MAG: hypothetical protein H8D97_01800 [Proteobacteria bacterium]|nr:hypothetical protein [Pseudomonadota bacterium]
MDCCKWATKTEQNRNQTTTKIKSIQEANKIRTMYVTGNYTQLEIAEIYNCDRKIISCCVVNNRTWT